MNILQILSQQDRWMSELEILEQTKCPLDVLIEELDTLILCRLIDDRLDEKFEQSYRLTRLGKNQLDRSSPQRKLSPFPPISCGPGN